MARPRKCARCPRTLSKKRQRKRYCYPCEVQVKRDQRLAAHDARVCKQYGLEPGDYQRLYEAQDGKCYLCRRANGRTKRLSVDHDHSCCKTLPACGRCVRGLLCGMCNRVVGHSRDSSAFFYRGATYLLYPPARKVLYGDGS